MKLTKGFFFLCVWGSNKKESFPFTQIEREGNFVNAPASYSHKNDVDAFCLCFCSMKKSEKALKCIFSQSCGFWSPTLSTFPL